MNYYAAAFVAELNKDCFMSSDLGRCMDSARLVTACYGRKRATGADLSGPSNSQGTSSYYSIVAGRLNHSRVQQVAPDVDAAEVAESPYSTGRSATSAVPGQAPEATDDSAVAAPAENGGFSTISAQQVAAPAEGGGFSRQKS